MSSSWFNKIKAFTLGWFISLLLWSVLRRFGIKAYLDIFQVEFSLYNILLLITIVSIIAGIIFGSIQFVYQKYFKRKISFRSLLLIAICIHVFVMFLLYLLTYVILRISGLDFNLLFVDFISSPLLLVNFLYTILINIIIIITVHINKLLGKGNLSKLLRGKFHNPKEELRVFMFLDLTSSTSIAEKLGHLKYSSFIQDCFYDLHIVEQYKAEIYQYVGDEVVLTWKVKEGETLDHCLHSYFAYATYLKKRSDYYTSSYGIIPLFRAGMHIGLITAVEVGQLKREIAYHGDTINTAARIQEQCRVFNASLLISDAVLNDIQKPDIFKFDVIGKELLRGKKKETGIYSVCENTKSRI